MPFDGNGIFLRVHNWVNDAAASIRIRADRHDQEDNNLASGLTNCITRDGQSSISANLPMSTYKHLNVGEATARNQYARADQVQDGKLNWAVAGGTADDLTLTYPFTFTLSDGQIVNFRASANNTGPVTIDVNSIGANPAVSGGGNAFVGGELVSGGEYSFRYNLANTRFELVGTPKPEAPTAAEVSVDDTDFEVFTGTDVQTVLEEADALFDGLGSSAVEDVGTSIGDVVQLEDVGGNAGLPAVDGSQLTGLPQPAKYIFQGTRTTGDVASGNIISMSSVDINEGSAWASNKFTVPKNGWAEVSVYFIAVANTTRISVRLNGTEYKDAYVNNATQMGGRTFIIPVSASDEIDFFVSNGTIKGDSPATPSTAGSSAPSFTIRML